MVRRTRRRRRGKEEGEPKEKTGGRAGKENRGGEKKGGGERGKYLEIVSEGLAKEDNVRFIE